MEYCYIICTPSEHFFSFYKPKAGIIALLKTL